VTVERLLDAGDPVAAVRWTRGRQGGIPFDVAIAQVWTVRGAQAPRFEASIDTPAIRQALGSR
jgi:ketosteroid isomerase-like protein